MAIIRSFNGWRPKPEQAAKVASRPYDVLNSEEAREEAAGNDISFYMFVNQKLIFPKILTIMLMQFMLKRLKTGKNFNRMGIFNMDATPNMYAYRQIMNGHAQVGLVANSSIEDYFNDIIKNTNIPVRKKKTTVFVIWLNYNATQNRYF